MIEGAFAWRLVTMLESPAYRVLSLSAHRVMARLEIEMAHHGGKPEENGRLPCTYEHFVEFGIDRHAIGAAIRELVALGFVEITRPGCAGNAGYRQPTLYRLTYRHCGSHKDTTDEWKGIGTVEEAEAIAKRSRSPQSERRQKNKSPVRETPIGASVGNPTNRVRSPVRETPTTVPVRETPTTSISRGVGPKADRVGHPTPPSLAARLADDAPTQGDTLLPNAPTALAAARPRLVWTRPVVRELTGAEADIRRTQVAALTRTSTIH